MFRVFLKVVFSEVVKVLTIPLRLLPVKNNRILFTGLTGGRVYDYSCNPKYIYEYLRDYYPETYEYVWAVSDKEKYSFLEEEGVKLVKHFTVSSFPMLLTSKIIVTNGSYAPWFPFRKKQYVINTWHGGGAYKKVENEKPDANWATRKRAEFCAGNIDLFLASCKVQEEQMIRTTYQYQGEVLRAGTPRNDNLVKGDIEDMAARVRVYYNIPENGRIVLYAPTYRTPSDLIVLDSDMLLDGLNRQVLEHAKPEKIQSLESDMAEMEQPSNWYFFSRYHRYQDGNKDIQVTGQQVIDVADYPDMQELLCAADMLITDYSSCVWDYAFLKRPCFLYVPDKEEYVANTGFYVDVDKWPFAQAYDMEGLMDCIESFDRNEMLQRIGLHMEEMGSYETGDCCRRIAEKINAESGKMNE